MPLGFDGMLDIPLPVRWGLCENDDEAGVAADISSGEDPREEGEVVEPPTKEAESRSLEGTLDCEFEGEKCALLRSMAGSGPAFKRETGDPVFCFFRLLAGDT